MPEPKDWPSTDRNAVLPECAWALIWEPNSGFSIMIPNEKTLANAGVTHIPEEAQAITAAMIRMSREPDFVEELVNWFQENSQ